MKKMKIILSVILAIVLIITPPVSVICLTVATPDQYDKTFLGVLDEKYDRLMSIEEEKIVVIGGSSVAFGLDSALLESYTGMPVVNFGLYADLGTKLMLDLARGGIKEGDVVIIAPESSVACSDTPRRQRRTHTAIAPTVSSAQSTISTGRVEL
jgi:hypothetical protein